MEREIEPRHCFDWNDELATRLAGYSEDPEICRARPLTLEQVAAALPPDEVTAGIAPRAACTGVVGPDMCESFRARLLAEEV